MVRLLQYLNLSLSEIVRDILETDSYLCRKLCRSFLFRLKITYDLLSSVLSLYLFKGCSAARLWTVC